ncbi:unnamed protein product, partial [Rotaria sp. Silwood1]
MRTCLQTLGKILWEMGKPNLAEKYFIRLLEQLPANDSLRRHLYQDLGRLASHVGDLDKSMEWRQKALDFKKQSQPAGSSSTRQTTNIK